MSSRISREHALGVDDQALPAQRLGDPPIAVVAVRERLALDQIAQVRVLPRRRVRAETAIVAGARHLAEGAQALGCWRRPRESLAVGRDHFFDDRVEVGAPPLRARRVPEPQGFAKKMQVRLLTADHPFKFGDPRLGLLQFVRGLRGGRDGVRRDRRRGRRAAPGRSPLLPSRLRPALAVEAGHAHRPIDVAPFVKQLALDPRLLGDRSDPLAGLQSQDHLFLERVRKLPWTLPGSDMVPPRKPCHPFTRVSTSGSIPLFSPKFRLSLRAPARSRGDDEALAGVFTHSTRPPSEGHR